MAYVTKTKSGNYQATVYIGGEIKKQRVVTAKTKEEALAKAIQLKQDVLSGAVSLTPAPKEAKSEVCALLTASTTDDMTVGDAVDRYIASKAKVLSPTTYAMYVNYRKNRYKDLMLVPLKALTSEIAQMAISQEMAQVTPKTVKNAYGLIMSAVHMFAPSLALTVTLPKLQKSEMYVPDETEIAKLLPLIKEHANGRLLKPFLLATQCGLRASEIAGLQIRDLGDNCIYIRRAEVHTADGIFTKSPKSVTSNRSIPASPALLAILRADCFGEKVTDFQSHEITQAWLRFRHKCNLPKHLNFHALRHHFASACLLKGIPQKYIAELMGHADTTMIERVYQHTFPSAMAVYANKITAEQLT